MCNAEPDWRTEEQKKIDLEIENRALEQEIEMQGGIMEKSDDIDPKLHNAFLNNVMAFEELDEEPKVPMKSLFPPDFDFPRLQDMTPEQLDQKLTAIEDILEMHKIYLGFANDLPDEVIYKHLIEDLIPHDMVFPDNYTGFNTIIDGCDGYCPGCFQKPYCKTSEEIGWDEEGLSGESAGPKEDIAEDLDL